MHDFVTKNFSMSIMHLYVSTFYVLTKFDLKSHMTLQQRFFLLSQE